jgi:hypothetical protein
MTFAFTAAGAPLGIAAADAVATEDDEGAALETEELDATAADRPAGSSRGAEFDRRGASTAVCRVSAK